MIIPLEGGGGVGGGDAAGYTISTVQQQQQSLIKALRAPYGLSQPKNASHNFGGRCASELCWLLITQMGARRLLR